MEYKRSTSPTWIKGTGKVITGLTDGRFDVRVKATGTVLAGETGTFNVATYISAPTVTIPYTLKNGEKAANVCGVYVDAKGKVQWITGSSYDSTAKVLRFSTNHFSTYGVGYKQDAPVVTDTQNQ